MALRYPIDDNDVMVYTLDETSGVFPNSSTSPNKPANSDMTLYNSVTRNQNGVFDKCCLFPASSSSRLSTSGPLYTGNAFSSGITMSCWVYLTGWGQTYSSYFMKSYRASGWSSPWGGAGFQHVDPQNTGTWYAKVVMDNGVGQPVDWGLSQGSPNLLPLNSWNYIALSYNRSVFKVFMNGRLVNQTNESRAPLFSDGPWHIGSSPESGNQGMQGYVDECRVCDIGRPDSYFKDVYGYYKSQYGAATQQTKYFYSSTLKSNEGAAPVADASKLPTTKRRWQFSVNNYVPNSGTRYNDRRNLLLGIKNALKNFTLNPWVVRRSSNGTTVADSDLWAAMADVNWSTSGNAHSWIVLRQAQLGSTFELCLNCVSSGADGGTIYVNVCHAGYDLATGSTTAKPTALGIEHALRSDSGWAGTAATSYNFRYHIMQSEDGQATRVVLCMNKIAQGFWIFDKADQVEITDTWPEPVVFMVQGGVTDGLQSAAYAIWNDQAWLFARTKIFSGYAEMKLYMTSEGCINAMLGEHSFGINELSGKMDMQPVGLFSVSDNMRGRHGQLKDLWWGPIGIPNGTLLPEGSAKSFVQFGNLILPWDGTSNVLVT